MEDKLFTFPTVGSGASLANAVPVRIMTPQPLDGSGSGVWAPSDFARRFCTILAEDRENLSEKVILDVGSGTGVLGIYALMLGAKSAYFIEPALGAESVTTKNVALNDIAKQTIFYSGTFLSFIQAKPDLNFDTIICNHFTSHKFNVDGADLLENLANEGSYVWPGADRSVLSHVINYMASRQGKSLTLYTHICEEQNPRWILENLTRYNLSYECYYSLYLPVETELFGNRIFEWRNKGLTQIRKDGIAVREAMFLKIWAL